MTCNPSHCFVRLSFQLYKLEGGFSSTKVSSIIKQTEEATRKEKLYPSDIKDVVYVLDKTKKINKSRADIKNFIKTSSNIVGRNNGPAWKHVKVSVNTILINIYEFSPFKITYSLSTVSESLTLLFCCPPSQTSCGLSFPPTNVCSTEYEIPFPIVS